MKVYEDARLLAPAEELATLLTALTALRRGDANVRLPLHWQGLAGKVADAFNEVVELNAAMAAELARLAAGRRQGRQAEAARVAGTRAASGASRSSPSTR